MIISQNTIEIVKNFSAITETGIVFPQGNTISVQDGSAVGDASQRGKTMLAVAELDNEIVEEFALHNPMQLYSCLTMFNEPQIEVEPNNVIITDSGNPKSGRFSITKASSMVVKQPGAIKFPEGDHIKFRMTSDMYQKLFRGVGIVSTSEIAIIGDGSDMICSAFETNNPTADKYSLPIGITEHKFQAVLNVDSINKLIRGIDYIVTLSTRGIIKFEAVDSDYKVTYYIAAKCTTN